MIIKKQKGQLKMIRPDLRATVSNNSTPTLENCSQVFADPENKIFIKNLFNGSVTQKKQEQKSKVPRPARLDGDNDLFEVNHVYVSFFSSKGCSIVVRTQFPNEKEVVISTNNKAINSKSIRETYQKEVIQMTEELATDSYGKDKYFEQLKLKQKALQQKDPDAIDFIK